MGGTTVRLPLLIVVPLAFLIGTGFAPGSLGTSSADPAITGTASVIDGDTIEVHGIRIRLEGIDAPESNQTCRAGEEVVPCGRSAAFHLADRIGRRPVTCEPRGTDRYERILAICAELGEDLNGMMVRDGHAVAYLQYSDRYAGEENAARRARLGLWSTEFEMPWRWRRNHR